MSHLNFWILAFSTNFCPIKSDLFDRKLQFFKNSPKLTIFAIFDELLSTQNVNIARFARNVEWDFFCDFQTQWSSFSNSHDDDDDILERKLSILWIWNDKNDQRFHICIDLIELWTLIFSIINFLSNI